VSRLWGPPGSVGGVPGPDVLSVGGSSFGSSAAVVSRPAATPRATWCAERYSGRRDGSREPSAHGQHKVDPELVKIVYARTPLGPAFPPSLNITAGAGESRFHLAVGRRN
jgi:hypothetical protein